MPIITKPDIESPNYDSDVSTSGYTRDEGLLVIPVMGPSGTPPKIVRVHAPIGYRTVQWAYSKRGAPPIMPSMVDTASGDVFLSGDLSVPVPALGGDQNQLDYVASGEYSYVQNVSGSGARIAGYRPSQGVVGITQVSPMGKFQTGRKPYFTPSLTTQILANGGQLGPGGLLGWPIPARQNSANALPGDIDFDSPDYKYYDTTISSLFFSDGLIL